MSDRGRRHPAARSSSAPSWRSTSPSARRRPGPPCASCASGTVRSPASFADGSHFAAPRRADRRDARVRPRAARAGRACVRIAAPHSCRGRRTSRPRRASRRGSAARTARPAATPRRVDEDHTASPRPAPIGRAALVPRRLGDRRCAEQLHCGARRRSIDRRCGPLSFMRSFAPRPSSRRVQRQRLAQPSDERQPVRRPLRPGRRQHDQGPAPPVDAGAAPVVVARRPPRHRLRRSALLGHSEPCSSSRRDARATSISSIPPRSAIYAHRRLLHRGAPTRGTTPSASPRPTRATPIVYAVDRTSKHSRRRRPEPEDHRLAGTARRDAGLRALRRADQRGLGHRAEPASDRGLHRSEPRQRRRRRTRRSSPSRRRSRVAGDRRATAGRRAYTHATTATIAIDVARTRSSRPVAERLHDVARHRASTRRNGWVMPACEEGLVVVLARRGRHHRHGAQLGAGVDQMSYDAQRLRLYVPGPAAAA